MIDAAHAAQASALKTPVRVSGPVFFISDLHLTASMPATAAAFERFLRTRAREPRNAQARFQRGVALAGLGRADDAIVAFSQMTQDFPELPEPYINLAALYAERGELLRARDSLIMANRVAPENALAQFNLGDVYVRLAAQSYQSAIKLNPKNATARARLDALPDLPGVHPATKPVTTTLPAASGVTAKPAKRQ
mgnify:CR=1 FL=1